MTTPLTISQIFTPDTQPQWLASLLANAGTVGLTTTSWHQGAPERTILTILSFALNFTDATASSFAQGAFLDWAATGTFTYENADGTTSTFPVTVDPSAPGNDPTGSGWLDVLVDARYNIQRIRSTSAGGPEAITNISVSTYGPFVAGTYHVADPFTKATYSNTATLSIPPSSAVGTSVSGVASASGIIQVTTSTAHGLTSGAAVTLIGVGGVTPLLNPTSWFVTVTGASTFTLNGSNFAGSYTGGGIVYTPTVATFTADAAGSASSSLNASGVPSINVVTQPVTSLVGTTVANLAVFLGSDVESNVALARRARLKLQSLSINGPGGAYAFAALSAQQLAPLLNPPAAVSSAITRTSVFTDKLTGNVVAWIANAAGAPSTPDVAAVNLVEQAYATPNAVTATAAAASNASIAAVADIWVPAALNTTATQALFQVALQSYFSTLAIGGASDTTGGNAYTNVVPFDAVMGALFTAAALAQIPIQQALLTLNGGGSNIPLTLSASAAQVAVLSPAPATVNLHSF